MKLEQQVVSLGLAKRLKELGVKQESLFWWNRQTKELVYADKKSILTNIWSQTTWYSAFTVAELGEMLPVEIYFKISPKDSFRVRAEWCIYKFGNCWSLVLEECSDREGKLYEDIRADTEADVRAKMLIYLLENKLID
jgi:hypothetical protein